MDDRGYVRIEGRLKDMIIRGGENIYPREIEDVLIMHPAVAEAAVIGVPMRRGVKKWRRSFGPLPDSSPRAKSCSRTVERTLRHTKLRANG